MRLLYNLFDFLFGGYDPEVFAAKWKEAPKQERTKRDRNDLPDDIQVNAVTGKLEQVTALDNNATEWETVQTRIKKAGLRVPFLTDYDLDEIEDRELDEVKAKVIKVEWAKGSTAKEAAKNLNGKGRFGESLVQKYYAAFSAALKIEMSEKVEENRGEAPTLTLDVM